MTIPEIIVQDEELSDLLMRAFKHRNDTIFEAMSTKIIQELANKIFEKYQIDIEVYT
jgi:hypothetical protein